ncbi:MAG: hypothetical protein JWQ63_712 [Mucilaginibacter sp.]|nr:hypothetical protein [Mucilaginibacter sp.]
MEEKSDRRKNQEVDFFSKPVHSRYKMNTNERFFALSIPEKSLHF